MNKGEKDALEVLVRYREICGVNKDNIYVFAVPNANSKMHLRENDCMKKILGQMNHLEAPEQIKSTEFRNSGSIEQRGNKLQIFQRMSFVGWLIIRVIQNLEVHREHYCLKD